MFTVHTPAEGIDDLRNLLAAGPAPFLAFDFETTGLDHRRDRPRLLSYLPFTWKDVQHPGQVRVVDLFQGEPHAVVALFDLLADCRLVAHNASFDLGWLIARGVFPRQRCYCTQVMAQQCISGERRAYGVFKKPNLENVLKWFLQVKIDKAMQLSPWGRTPLSHAQLEYAATDVLHLPRLLRTLSEILQTQGQSPVGTIESEALPAVAWISVMGVPFDPARWVEPLGRATAKRDEAARTILARWLTPYVMGRMEGDLHAGKSQAYFPWGNHDEGRRLRVLSSHPQTKRFLEIALQREIPGTSDEVLAELDHPLCETLRDWREGRQIVTNFGATWGKSPAPKTKKAAAQWAKESLSPPPPPVRGEAPYFRVHPAVRQHGTETGRMSYAYPNLQQIPNPAKHELGAMFRRAFVAPPGRRLVKADYSQMELRIAAQISRDPYLLKAYGDGLDIHTEGARWVLGKADPSKHDRQVMKSANFGLLYGAGVARFRAYARAAFGVRLTMEEAADIRGRWLDTFQGVKAWHQGVGRQIDRAGQQGLTTRTLAGRARFQVGRYSEALNTPVQGTGGDVVKIALGRLYADRDNAPCPPGWAAGHGWFPVLVVHDEIVLEGPEEHADALAAWLKGHMGAAGQPLTPDVPCVADATAVKNWAGGED